MIPYKESCSKHTSCPQLRGVTGTVNTGHVPVPPVLYCCVAGMFGRSLVKHDRTGVKLRIYDGDSGVPGGVLPALSCIPLLLETHAGICSSAKILLLPKASRGASAAVFQISVLSFFVLNSTGHRTAVKPRVFLTATGMRRVITTGVRYTISFSPETPPCRRPASCLSCAASLPSLGWRNGRLCRGVRWGP